VLANQRRGVQAADWFEQVTAQRSRMLDQLARIESSELATRAINLKRIRGLLQEMPELGTGTGSMSPNYREILGSAFMTGRFIRWFEASVKGGS
jgi:asparagine synthase (glutamine-hydrolysing)